VTWRVVAAITALTLTAAACGGDDSGNSSDTTTGSATTAAAATTAASGGATTTSGGGASTTAKAGASTTAGGASTTAAFNRADFNLDAEINVTTDGNPANLDPHQEPTQGSTPYWTPVYDTITDIALAGEVRPRLATDWEYSDDGLSLVLTIRDGVKFHDGTPLDAAAVAKSLNRARTDEKSTQKNLYRNVTDVQATGPMEVTLTLSTYDPALPWILGTAAGAVVNPKAIDAGTDLTGTSDGTGAYVVTSFEPNVKVTYERAPDEPWDPATGLLKGFALSVLTDYQVALNGLQGGQYDLIRLNGLGQAVDNVVKSGDFTRTQLPSLQTLSFWLNNQDPAFKDVRVRQAFQYALDREGIVNAVFDKGSECAATSQVAPFEGDGLYVEGYDPYPYNLDKAKQLLQDAGAVGTKLTITDIGATNTGNLMTAAEPMLEAAGFDVELVRGTTQTAPSFQKGELQVAVIPNAKQAHPSIFLQRYWLTDGPYHLAKGEDQQILDEMAKWTPQASEADVAATNEAIAKILAEDISTLVVGCNVVWSEVGKNTIAGIDPKTLLLNMRVVGEKKD